MGEMSSELAAIQNWIAMKGADGIEIEMDTDLIENRIIDSLAFAEFLMVLEDISGTAIDLENIDLQAFRTLRSIQSNFLKNAMTTRRGQK